MKESVAVAKEADAKKGFSPAKDNSIYRARNESDRQLGSLRSVIGNISGKNGLGVILGVISPLSARLRREAVCFIQTVGWTRVDGAVQE